MVTERVEGSGMSPPAVVPVIDQEVLARFRQALEEVDERATAFVARTVRDPHLRDDVNAHWRAALWFKVKRGDAFEQPVIAWVITVARNKVISEWRLRYRAAEVSTDALSDESASLYRPNLSDPAATVVSSAAFEDLLERVEKTIADPDQYRVWWMSVVGELTGVEIAQTLGCHPSTVSRQLKLAREKLTVGLASGTA